MRVKDRAELLFIHTLLGIRRASPSPRKIHSLTVSLRHGAATNSRDEHIEVELQIAPPCFRLITPNFYLSIPPKIPGGNRKEKQRANIFNFHHISRQQVYRLKKEFMTKAAPPQALKWLSELYQWLHSCLKLLTAGLRPPDAGLIYTAAMRVDELGPRGQRD